MKNIESPFTVRICRFLKSKPSTIATLAAHFGESEERTRNTISNLRKGGFVWSEDERPKPSVYQCRAIPNPARRPTTKDRKPKVAKETPAVPSAPRRYQPEFRPLIDRDKLSAIHHFLR